MLSRRRLLRLAAGSVAPTLWSRVTRAQAYPTRPVRLVVGFPAGSAPDVVARVVAPALAERFGPQFVVENRPGAGSNIATEAVVRAPADGYTLLMLVATNTVNATLYSNLSFDLIRDIAPVGGIAGTDYVLLVTPALPARSVPELIAHAKANPGMINMASAGSGSGPHVVGELFKMMAGVDFVHVPYRGSYFPDLLGGQVQLAFIPMPGAISYVRAGTLRALAVSGAARSDALPDVPTIGEFVPGYEALGWYGLGVPAGTPPTIVERLNGETNAALADPAVKARLGNLGVDPLPMTAAGFGQFMRDETAKWSRVIKFANIRPD
jgi:tripartite-type tricarboxylate transporter receptor subunit TctC